MNKLKLPNVTLLAMTSVLINDTIRALKYSSKDIEFGSVKLISHEKPEDLPSDITHQYINNIGNIDSWNYNIVYKLHEYVDTDFVLLIHDDGFVINSSSWKDEFLNYDYIGAPWGHKHFIDINGNQIRVGNSVSLRSKKLLELPSKYNMPWLPFDGNFNEDTQICVWNRDFFLNHGIKFANYELAKYFSHETIFEDFEGIEPFCFHNFGGENEKYKELINKYEY